jgi:hypothetical protein
LVELPHLTNKERNERVSARITLCMSGDWYLSVNDSPGSIRLDFTMFDVMRTTSVRLPRPQEARRRGEILSSPLAGHEDRTWICV